jgi:AcrR family transcriptional regulator
VRAEIAEVAIDLFTRQGFENTTVDEIASAGMTKRSFFRYFPTKDDVVFDGVDLTGADVVADIAARPAGEDPWESLHHVLRARQGEIHASEQVLVTLRLIEATPALIGRLHQRRAEWRRRVGDAPTPRPLYWMPCPVNGCDQAAKRTAPVFSTKDSSTSMWIPTRNRSSPQHVGYSSLTSCPATTSHPPRSPESPDLR